MTSPRELPRLRAARGRPSPASALGRRSNAGGLGGGDLDAAAPIPAGVRRGEPHAAHAVSARQEARCSGRRVGGRRRGGRRKGAPGSPRTATSEARAQEESQAPSTLSDLASRDPRSGLSLRRHGQNDFGRALLPAGARGDGSPGIAEGARADRGRRGGLARRAHSRRQSDRNACHGARRCRTQDTERDEAHPLERRTRLAASARRRLQAPLARRTPCRTPPPKPRCSPVAWGVGEGHGPHA